MGQNVYKNQYSPPSVLHTIWYLQIKHSTTLAIKPLFSCVSSKAYLVQVINLCCLTYTRAETNALGAVSFLHINWKNT